MARSKRSPGERSDTRDLLQQVTTVGVMGGGRTCLRGR